MDFGILRILFELFNWFIFFFCKIRIILFIFYGWYEDEMKL